MALRAVAAYDLIFEIIQAAATARHRWGHEMNGYEPVASAAPPVSGGVVWGCGGGVAVGGNRGAGGGSAGRVGCVCGGGSGDVGWGWGGGGVGWEGVGLGGWGGWGVGVVEKVLVLSWGNEVVCRVFGQWGGVVSSGGELVLWCWGCGGL